MSTALKLPEKEFRALLNRSVMVGGALRVYETPEDADEVRRILVVEDERI